MKIAIIGLGIIGAQWAKHLHTDKVLTACWNRSPKEDIPLFQNKLDQLPTQADILHICLADPAAVGSVLDVISGQLGTNHLVIQSSTIDPTSASRFRTLVQSKGASYVEAPFTGSLPAAERRELIFYLGGDAGSIENSKSYLERLSKKLVVVGNEKQAATIKLAMNLQIASVMQALAEALTISRSASIPDQVFFEAFKLNASYSGVAALKEPKLIANDFTAQFSTKHMAKDLRLLRSEYKGEAVPFLEVLQGVYRTAIETGLSEQDFSALIKLCEE